MKLSLVAKLRIPVLLALVIGEIAGLTLFFATPNFLSFLFLSIIGTVSTACLFWAEWSDNRGLSQYDLSFLAMMTAVVIDSWNDNSRVLALVIAAILLLVNIPTFVRVFRPDVFAQNKADIMQSMKRVFGGYGPVVANALSLIGYVTTAWVLCHRTTSILWAFPVMPPILWIIWQLISSVFTRQKADGAVNASIESATNPGDPA
jgi:hypothetical protein